MALKSLKDTTLYIKDGGSNIIEVGIGDGNITWSENRSVEYTLNRGVLDEAGGGEARLGDDQPISVSFDVKYEYSKSSGSEAITVEEALKQLRGASGWTTVTTDPCAPYAVNIDVVTAPACSGAGNTVPVEVITLESFRWETLDYDVEAGQISCSGTCQKTTITAERYATDPNA
jgi:hypothetical protein